MKILPLIMILMLAGCGADSDNVSNATLKDIQGTWYGTYDDDGITVEEYTVIRGNGDFMEYDYPTDENCYNTYTNIVSKLEDQGDGSFIKSDLEDGEYTYHTIAISLSGDEIIFKGTEIDGITSYEVRRVKSDFPESYFTDLLCVPAT